MFRTEVPVDNYSHPLTYDAKILSLGSCFAENISEKLSFYKFQNISNPFGIIYNPVSIERVITRIVNQEFYTENDIFFYNHRWHCFEVHSKLSHSNKDMYLENLNAILKNSFAEIKILTHCIITYGTSWVYEHELAGKIVSNCHKIPQNHFTKRLLNATEIKNAINNTVQLIRSVNPDLKFIVTISPVRHIKDGYVQNNVGKSLLTQSIFEILHTNSSVNYFPSYEIMLDELRDYRFYADDMLHPSSLAIQYIWSKFRASYINPDLNSVLDEIEKIQKSLQHKPFDTNTPDYEAFSAKLKAKITNLESRFPQIKF